MSKNEALYQSLASCGAAVIVFNGIAHRFAAEALFPWGPAFFHSRFIFVGIGVLAIVGGLLSLGGILRFFFFPVIAVSLVTAAAGIAIVVICEGLHNQFNVFALAVAFSGLLTAYCYRKAVVESRS